MATSTAKLANHSTSPHPLARLKSLVRYIAPVAMTVALPLSLSTVVPLKLSVPIVVAPYSLYYLATAVHKPHAWVSHEKQQTLARKMKSLEERYWPTIWAVNAHIQTVASIFRHVPHMTFERELLTLSDGGHVAIDWENSPGEGVYHTVPGGDFVPTVIVMHGLTGGSGESYVRHLIETFRDQMGWRCVVFNYRGCAESDLKSPKGYCAAWTHDAVEVAKHVRDVIGRDTPLMAVGVSLGSMILTKLVAELSDNEGERNHINLLAAISVSNPFNMFKAQKGMESGLNLRLYNRVLTDRLKSYAQRHSDIFELHPGVDLSKVLKSQTIREFEHHAICPMFNYPSVDHYYDDGSSDQYVPKVKIPMMFLNAKDDPFTAGIPYEQCLENENVLLVTTERGGHVGWMEGFFPFGKTLMDRICLEYFLAVLDEQDPLNIK